MLYDGLTIQQVIAKVVAGQTVTQLQKCAFDLYAAQGGFRGTGLPTL